MKRADAEVLTVDDLAKLFACDKETAAARLTSGDLPGVKVGRGWIIPRQALFERLNEKAREESAARRAQQEATLHKAQQLGHSTRLQTTRDTAALGAPTVLDKAPTRPGRRRREPPTLPLLTAQLAQSDVAEG